MFVREKRIGAYSYLYLVETARETGKTKQRIIRSSSINGKRRFSPMPVAPQERIAIFCGNALHSVGANLCKRLVRRLDA